MKTLWKRRFLHRTCKSGLQVRQEGGRQVRRTVRHYSLEVILSADEKSLGELGQLTKRLSKKKGEHDADE